MILFLIVAALLVLAALYLAHSAWTPFGSRGRRRLIQWARGWWRGDQAENRSEY